MNSRMSRLRRSRRICRSSFTRTAQTSLMPRFVPRHDRRRRGTRPRATARPARAPVTVSPAPASADRISSAGVVPAREARRGRPCRRDSSSRPAGSASSQRHRRPPDRGDRTSTIGRSSNAAFSSLVVPSAASRPGVHDRDAIAAFGFVEIVRRHEHGRAGARQVVDQPPELAAGDGIDAAGRLVEKEIGGSCRSAQPSASRWRQPPGSVRASSRSRPASPPISSANRRRRSSRSPVEPVQPGIEPDVLLDRQQLVEREPLRHVADAPLDALRIAADVDAVDRARGRTTASAGRRACGSSWTCRRRCCRETRRPRRAGRRTSRRRRRGTRRTTATGARRESRASAGHHCPPIARTSARFVRCAATPAAAFAPARLRAARAARRALRCSSRRRRGSVPRRRAALRSPR